MYNILEDTDRIIFVTAETSQHYLKMAVYSAGHGKQTQIIEVENPRLAAEEVGHQGIVASWLDSQGGGTAYTRFSDGEYRCLEMPVSEKRHSDMVNLVLGLDLSVSSCYGADYKP